MNYQNGFCKLVKKFGTEKFTLIGLLAVEIPKDKERVFFTCLQAGEAVKLHLDRASRCYCDNRNSCCHTPAGT